MKKVSEAILKLLKQKVNSRCQNDKKREDAEQKPLSMTPCFSKGFTLIELLVVVLIIGILAAIAVPNYQNAVNKSRMAEGMSNLRKIVQAQQIYQAANSTDEWTNDIDSLGLDLPSDSILRTGQDMLNRSKTDGKWRYYCYSMSACVAFLGNPDLPGLEMQRGVWAGKVRCRFYDGKTDKARKFCKKQLNCIDQNYMEAMYCLLPN